jgi:hypothetical protein
MEGRGEELEWLTPFGHARQYFNSRNNIALSQHSSIPDA